MSNKDYVESYTHNLSQLKTFKTVEECYNDLLKRRNNVLQKYDTVYGHKVYKFNHRMYGWKILTSDVWKDNQFWASQKTVKSTTNR